MRTQQAPCCGAPAPQPACLGAPRPPAMRPRPSPPAPSLGPWLRAPRGGSSPSRGSRWPRLVFALPSLRAGSPRGGSGRPCFVSGAAHPSALPRRVPPRALAPPAGGARGSLGLLPPQPSARGLRPRGACGPYGPLFPPRPPGLFLCSCGPARAALPFGLLLRLFAAVARPLVALSFGWPLGRSWARCALRRFALSSG